MSRLQIKSRKRKFFKLYFSTFVSFPLFELSGWNQIRIGIQFGLDLFFDALYISAEFQLDSFTFQSSQSNCKQMKTDFKNLISKVFSTIIQQLNRDFPVGQSLETKVRSSFKLHLLRSRGLVDCNSNQVESIDEIALLGKLGCCTLENYLARVDFF